MLVRELTLRHAHRHIALHGNDDEGTVARVQHDFDQVSRCQLERPISDRV